MKAVLVIEMPNEYADCYNVNEMYVWGLIVQDKHGYAMFDLVTDKPSHLRPLPSFKAVDLNDTRDVMMFCHGWNACLEDITGETE